MATLSLVAVNGATSAEIIIIKKSVYKLNSLEQTINVPPIYLE